MYSIVKLIRASKTYFVIKLEINVKIYIEQKYIESRELAVDGNFYFAAVDDDNQPVKLLD